MFRRGKLAEDMISLESPELIDLFSTYQNEAIAARKFLSSSLNELSPGTEILEVGGGILALAIQLASEGFKVTTVEPIGEGFTSISIIMDIFMEIARQEDLKFNLIKSPIEECEFDQQFDLIFSINVMEHLKNPYNVLLQMVELLKQGGKYRFFCPNYDFPYEPHFGKWMFLRRNGAFYLRASRASKPSIGHADSIGLYKSINFLTERKIRILSLSNNLKYDAKQNASYEVLNRSLVDAELQKRHPGLYQVVLVIQKLNLLYAVKYFPKRFQPVIDCTISGTSKTVIDGTKVRN